MMHTSEYITLSIIAVAVIWLTYKLYRIFLKWVKKDTIRNRRWMLVLLCFSPVIIYFLSHYFLKYIQVFHQIGEVRYSIIKLAIYLIAIAACNTLIEPFDKGFTLKKAAALLLIIPYLLATIIHLIVIILSILELFYPSKNYYPLF